MHAFSRVPPASNCSGGGRSTFVCHSGTTERRRGDSYLGKDFSEPPGLPEDVHIAKKMECVDCHQTDPGGMGHIERKATCQDCHLEAEQAMAASVHKTLACEACHVKILGGYEMTSWGPGLIESRPNPFKKYSLYYGPQGPPVLIKDQNGRWMPVKIWPNSAGGIKDTIQPRPGLTFRWPKGETHDAYALLGTFSFPGGNNNYLVWIQLEQVAHPLGKSRTCESCHASNAQTADVTWRYFDSQGAEPFTGSQKVVADKNGLHVKDIRATSKIAPMEGGRTEFFAAWLHLGDIWKTAGDFSIPKYDPAKYRNLNKDMRIALVRLNAIDRNLKAREAGGENVKKLRRRWKEAKAAAAHDPESAGKLIAELESGAR
ncbi:MAG TPA: cytochrome c3 family protein [Nitrospirota bacterium]